MADFPGLKVVIVDDEKSVLRALELVLSASGFDITAFSDPNEAFSQLNSGLECSVLVSDLRMPGLSGVELIQAVKKIRSIQSILISGHATDLEAKEILTLGVDKVLRKPFSPVELLKCIEEVSRYHTGVR